MAQHVIADSSLMEASAEAPSWPQLALALASSLSGGLPWHFLVFFLCFCLTRLICVCMWCVCAHVWCVVYTCVHTPVSSKVHLTSWLRSPPLAEDSLRPRLCFILRRHSLGRVWAPHSLKAASAYAQPSYEDAALWGSGQARKLPCPALKSGKTGAPQPPPTELKLESLAEPACPVAALSSSLTLSGALPALWLSARELGWSRDKLPLAV